MASDTPDLRPLLDAVRSGCEQAAREVTGLLYDQVRRIVLCHLPLREDPEDLMQEIFLKMFTRLDQFRGDVPLQHWVARIAVTTCLDHLRRQKARPELRWSDLSQEEQALLDQRADSEQAADTDADAAAARQLIEKLLAQLPPSDGLILRMIELNQQSLAEVCAVTGWMSGAARVRLFRARRRLAALFKEMETRRK